MEATESLKEISDIKGNLLKLTDIAMWEPQKFEEFFVFLEFFYNDGRLGGMVNVDTVVMLETYSSSGSSCTEFMSRIDLPTHDDQLTDEERTRFRYRVQSMSNMVQKYLKTKAPGALSPLSAKKYRHKPQYEWMRELYDDEGRVRYVSQDKEPDPEPVTAIVSQETTYPEAITPLHERLAHAIERVIGVYDELASSITVEEINSLPIKDKISALNKMSYIHGSVGKMRQPSKITQININNASADDLEKSLLGIGLGEEE